jgi:hypothetical protein
MPMQWLVAKYVSDLRRHEPQNVGVLLFTDQGVFSRFLGQRENRIDGRFVRWARSLENYKGWVDFWQRSSKGATSAREYLNQMQRRSIDSYFLEMGGERLVGSAGTDAESVLDDLYSSLVEQPAPETLSVFNLAESVLKRAALGSKLKRKVELTVDGDEILFDYQYDNSVPNLMQRVSLSLGDERSWNNVYAASLTFEIAQKDEAAEKLGGRPQRIALIKPRECDQALERQLSMLGHHADVVIDVSSEDAAVARLMDALHLPNANRVRID